MNREPTEKQKQLLKASEYLAAQLGLGRQSDDGKYPLNRGDVMYLVMLLDLEMKVESDPFVVKRLAAIREKLGRMAFELPQMAREEARQFRD